MWKAIATSLGPVIPPLLCVHRLQVSHGLPAIPNAALSLAAHRSYLATRFLPFSHLPILRDRTTRTGDLGRQYILRWLHLFNRGLL